MFSIPLEILLPRPSLPYHGSASAKPSHPDIPEQDGDLLQTPSSLPDACIVTLRLQNTAVPCLVAKFHVDMLKEGTGRLSSCCFPWWSRIICGERLLLARGIRYTAVESRACCIRYLSSERGVMFARVRPDGSWDVEIGW